MIANYLITALRSFTQQKQHFILNVVGLSVGLAAAILVASFARNELSYDSQQPDAEQIYRIGQDYTKLGLAVVPISNFARAKEMEQYSQIESVFALTKVDWTNQAETDVQHNGQGYKLTEVLGATPNIQDFINIDTLTGDLNNALSVPNGIALNESEALRIFGTINIEGETLDFKGGQYTVKAVFKDLPENTHFSFKSLVYVEHDLSNLDINSNYVYLKLAENTDVAALEQIFTDKYFDDR